MTVSWRDIFDNFGIKIVTATDKNKSAYIPTVSQKVAISATGLYPDEKRDFKISILLDPKINITTASYYNSARSKKAARAPETRIGLAFISSWLNEGDEVIIGNIGPKLYAAKIKSIAIKNITKNSEEKIKEEAKGLTKEEIFSRAREAPISPETTEVLRNEKIRNFWVVEATLERASGRCEMPNCIHTLFVRDDGTNYLEVHHVIPLGENGPDQLRNTAALCPNCHRQLHSGRDRNIIRVALAMYVDTLPD